MARLGSTARLLVWFALMTPWVSSRAGGPSRPLEYNRDIRPILSENCFACHGPDKGARKAGLRLDDRASAIAQGAISPRQPDESELIARIISDDAEEMMPPPDSTKRLSLDHKALLKRWVLEGAEYQAHWAYEPIRRPEVPPVRDPSRVGNPIDAFILNGLEAKNITPSPEADRRTILRRLSLDLIGLPPRPDEVIAFDRDPAPDAYEKVVDRLLASPHFGERMAVPWLDLVRFADTVGYHGDQNQNVFPYRDYVIDSFNANKPFDQFTVEQIAGDLVPDPTPSQRVATAFNRLNMVTREGGAQDKEYLAKYTADRVRTVAITWLGSTMGCAECHDHKFDPFSAKDFYRMGAFFADVEQWGVYADYGYSPNTDLQGFGNDHPFPPEIDVASPHLLRRLESLDRKIQGVFAATATKILGSDPGRSALDDWSARTSTFLRDHPEGWATPTPAESANGPTPGVEAQPDGSFKLTGDLESEKPLSLRLKPEPGWLASIRLELLPTPDNGGRITRKPQPSLSIKLKATLESSKPAQKLAFYRSDADAKEPTYSQGQVALNLLDGWRPSISRPTERQSAVYLLDKPIRFEPGDSLTIHLDPGTAGCVRISASPISFDDPARPVVDPDLTQALSIDRDDRTEAQRTKVSDAFLLGTGFDGAALAEVHRLILDRAECRKGQARVVVTKARAPLPTRVLPRGNWQDESGEQVLPGVPHFLPQPEGAGSRRMDRLDLARWITSADNPLTPRVFANRLWKQFFGVGIAAVMEDVGAQGEWPSDPDLLDWLAVDFRDHGWDIKRLVKQLVMSNTYRQSSRLRGELRELDPNNRWLASQSPRRLDAEFVRDNALSIAGLLNPDLGGPSVFPYQPPGYYAAIQFPSRDYIPQRDGRQHRRGIYTHWQRTFPHPMLANFDAPSREECIAARNLANTPQQALTLLNDPCFVEAAREFARSVLEDDEETPKGDEAKLDQVFRRALGRPAREREAESLVRFLDARRAENRQNPESARRLVEGDGPPTKDSGLDPIEWAAWVEVCRVVLNLHETITRY